MTTGCNGYSFLCFCLLRRASDIIKGSSISQAVRTGRVCLWQIGLKFPISFFLNLFSLPRELIHCCACWMSVDPTNGNESLKRHLAHRRTSRTTSKFKRIFLSFSLSQKRWIEIMIWALKDPYSWKPDNWLLDASRLRNVIYTRRVFFVRLKRDFQELSLY